MLNTIWPFFIIISIISYFVNGNIESFNNTLFNSANEGINTILTLIGSMCLWNGLMNIAKETKLVEKIEKRLIPIINFLFPDMKKEEKIKKEISMNMIANILGLGNAATPLGLKAIDSMQKINNNKEELSPSMMMLIVINTASLQIIPTTVIAIRNSLGSKDPTSIIIPVWIATISAGIAGIAAIKILIKIIKRGKRKK